MCVVINNSKLGQNDVPIFLFFLWGVVGGGLKVFSLEAKEIRLKSLKEKVKAILLPLPPTQFFNHYFSVLVEKFLEQNRDT